ncbi:MAG: CAF17-like 4Fe-4S cluster assembly/insertion protein YgfZ, partial [Alphaproteobacteria bacterium]|jgi:folate-binding protein YgfZ
MTVAAWAQDRGLIQVGGAEAEPFLQGLISNDITKVTPGRAIYAALLTPQGKFLHDFFIAQVGESLFIDCEAARRQDLFTRLKRYRLRAKVDLADVTDEWSVGIVWGEGALAAVELTADTGSATALGNGVAYCDPRHAGLGARLLVPVAEREALSLNMNSGLRADHDHLRLAMGIPDGATDLAVDKSFLLESGFDELNGIDWKKGCYVGQEVTARTKYRGLVRRRLAPVDLKGDGLAEDGRIMADGRDVGELRSHMGERGLALLKLDAMQAGAVMTCGGAVLTPHLPDWWILPAPAADDAATT